MLPYNNNENSSGFNPNAVQQSTTIPNAQTQQIFQHNNQEPDNKGDDGSLSFLNIPPDTSRKVFDCKETNQGRLSNMTFWILDYYADIIASWWGWLKYTNSINLVKTIEKSLGYEIKFNRHADRIA